LTEKVRSAGDIYFSRLCDRIGYNTLTSSDIEFLKVAYIVASNKKREEVNLELLRKFYIEQDGVTVTATDKFPSEAYLDKNLPYTQTGVNIINR
jgi:hypothetical protein